VETTVERVDDTTVKLTVTVESERVTAAIESAARTLSQQVKVPGFRPGRVPRRVLESRLGRETLLSEAAREALPTFYGEAVEAESLAVVSAPELDVDTFTEADGAIFSATVEVRPEVEVPDYGHLQIPHPDWEVTEEEITEQLDALRERFADLADVDRPAAVGDYVVLTILGERDGERLAEASGEDLLYTVSDPAESESELDRHLVGAAAGETVTFTDALGEDYGEELAGAEVDFTVDVIAVKERRLPELDDDFAVTATEFDTAEELVSELRRQLGAHKLGNARMELRGKVVEAVSELVDVPLPKAMVSEEVSFRLQRLEAQAEQYGLSFDQYVAMGGTSIDELYGNLESEAARTVKAQLVIDAIGRQEGITVDQEDLGVEIARQAQRLGRDPQELAQLMTHPDRITALVSDAFRRKTIDHIAASVQVLSAPPEDAEAAFAPPPTDADETTEGADAAQPADEPTAAQPAEQPAEEPTA
jgi:trigger factor